MSTQRQKTTLRKPELLESVASSHQLGMEAYVQQRNHTLKTWEEIPEWQQDNEYILTGYREASYSYKLSVLSILYLHNETINIYSHLLGVVIFLMLPIFTYLSLGSRATTSDVIVFSAFFYGVAICFFLSSTYHIIANHSPVVQKWGNQLDYLGIVILMYGATIPSIYYGFLCDQQLQKLYWTNVSALALLCSIATLHPQFRHPTIRPWRSVMYAGLGLSAIAFVVHGIVRHGWEMQEARMSISWMMWMAGFNLTGAVTYAIRIPERLYPATFDIFGNSHQILHVAVIFAGLAHYLGLLKAFSFAHSEAGKCG